MVQSNGKHLEGTYVTCLSLRTTIHLKKANNHIILEGQKYIISVTESCNVYVWECPLDIYKTLEELTIWMVSLSHYLRRSWSLLGQCIFKLCRWEILKFVSLKFVSYKANDTTIYIFTFFSFVSQSTFLEI